MRKNLPLLMLFLALLVIAAYYYLTDRRSRYNDTDNRFAVKDTARVDRIIISGQQDSLVLDREQGSWMVNGVHHARKQLMNDLLLALYRQEADVPVAEKDVDRISRQLTADARKVQVCQGRSLLKAFSLNYDSITAASYMVLDGTGEVFRISLPGLPNRDITLVYRLEEDYWRDKLLFRLSPEEISGVRVVYPRRPDASFSITRGPAGQWSLVSFPDNNEVAGCSREALGRYLSYIPQLRFDELLDPDILKSLPAGVKAVAAVLITLYSGKEIRFSLIPRYRQDGKMDLDRLYLSMEGQDEIMLARYVQVDLILKDISYFIGQDQ
jgi:hypothetical protein